MSDLGELYQTLILDHNKKPRNFGALDGATHRAEGHNPLCGDRLTVYLKLDGDRVVDVRFAGSGCAISKASASLMTTVVKGKTRAEVEHLYRRFHDTVTTDATAAVDTADLGKLAVFAGVREYPSRVKCASLSWHTLKGALEDTALVSTE